jgi:hypothetical protein
MPGKKRKRKPNQPRHKGLKRPARLQAAKHWLPGYTGKNILRGYAKHFAVNLLCAITELEALGVDLDPKYVENIKAMLANRRRKKKTVPERNKTLPSFESDFYHARIMGYTSNGFSYGITWEEWRELEHKQNSQGHAGEVYEGIPGVYEDFPENYEDIPF